MNEHQQKAGEQRAGDRLDGIRAAINDADATGLVAGEELITQAETMLPLEDLHRALPQEHAAHKTIDDLHAQVQSDSPDPSAIESHVSHLRSLPELEAIVANWWEHPTTQRFIANLNQIGL